MVVTRGDDMSNTKFICKNCGDDLTGVVNSREELAEAEIACETLDRFNHEGMP